MRDLFYGLYQHVSQIYLMPRLYLVWGLAIALMVLGYFWVPLFPLGQWLFGISFLLLVLEGWMLFRIEAGIQAERELPDRLSNGDSNAMKLKLFNAYPFQVVLQVYDEVPTQFQLRDQLFFTGLTPGEKKAISYSLRPVARGEYEFGLIRVFCSSSIQFLSRRYLLGSPQTLPCYPSFIQMKKYQFLAISNRLSEAGIKPIRRLGHTTEFEQIKEYVRGDDFRTLNWKASARSAKLMVNQYTDERSQQIYCLIDKSRIMKMPFDGMRLLDYAINAALVLSNIALLKQDKAGLITFAEKVDAFLKADNRQIQMNYIMELLYRQETQYLEAGMDRLYITVRRKIPQRSLLILFTNFESLSGMRRQLSFLKNLAQAHKLIVVFFENTELKSLLERRPDSTREIYLQTIGEHIAFEKKQIVREFKQNGIMSVLTRPEYLTAETINAYLKIKSRRML